MSEIERLKGWMKGISRGPGWHGPAIAHVLKGVTARQAAARPIESAHTIWEIVLHMLAWQAWTLRAVKGRRLKHLSPSAAWPPLRETSPAAWRRDRARLLSHYDRLRAALADWPEARLAERVRGQPYTFGTLLQGIVHHDVYHTGQLALLKKAVADRSARTKRP